MAAATAGNHGAVAATTVAGEGGRHYASYLEDCNRKGIMRPQTAFYDQRATANPELRRRITVTKKSTELLEGRPGKGRKYDQSLYAPNQGKRLPRKEFINMAVRPKLRRQESFNIHPRCEQRNQYSQGYKLDNFVVPDHLLELPELSDSSESAQETESDSDFEPRPKARKQTIVAPAPARSQSHAHVPMAAVPSRPTILSHPSRARAKDVDGPTSRLDPVIANRQWPSFCAVLVALLICFMVLAATVSNAHKQLE